MSDKKCVSCKNTVGTIRSTDTKWYCDYCFTDKINIGDKFLNFLLTVKKHLINRDSV